jgi:hypothetical protein
MAKFEFIAKPSGDGECFQFEIHKEELIKLKGKKFYEDEIKFMKESHEELYETKFIKPTKFKLYPGEFFKLTNPNKKLKISITTEEI